MGQCRSGWKVRVSNEDATFFQKVRHGPDCGRDSMVSIESEAGRNPLRRLNEEGRELPRPTDRARMLTESEIEAEYTEIHLH